MWCRHASETSLVLLIFTMMLHFNFSHAFIMSIIVDISICLAYVILSLYSLSSNLKLSDSIAYTSLSVDNMFSRLYLVCLEYHTL